MSSLYAIVIICNGMVCERKMSMAPAYITPEVCALDARNDMNRWIAVNRPGWFVSSAWCGLSRGEKV